MSNPLFILASLLLVNASNAQITLTSFDLPVPGVRASFITDSSPAEISPGISGPDQSWDLSAIQAGDTVITVFASPDSVSGYSFFYEADIAVPDSQNTGNAFFQITDTSLILLGQYTDYGQGMKPLNFSPPQTWLALPGVYQSHFEGVSTFEMKFPYNYPPFDSMKVRTTLQYSSLMDGWGTLTTRDDTLVDCLRQQYAEIRIDSTFFHYNTYWAAGGIPFRDTAITFRWWTNEAKIFIAEIVTKTSGAATAARYLMNPAPLCNLFASASSSGETGFNKADGIAEVMTTGGTAPYFYHWSNGKNEALVNALAPGLYVVTVSDAINCKAKDTVFINPYPCALSINISSTDETIPGSHDGTATVHVSGGQMPYTYLWSNISPDSVIISLPPGIYAVTVTDSAGCPLSDSVIINGGNCNLTIDSISITPIKCAEEPGGALQVFYSGGLPPYVFIWSNGDTTQINDSLFTGEYAVTVSDAGNCYAAYSETVSSPLPLSLTFIITPDSGLANGSSTAVVSGGSPPYSFCWNTVPATSGFIVNELASGNYTITVTDSNNCSIVDSVFVPLYVSDQDQQFTHGLVNMYPNPVGDNLFIQTGILPPGNLKICLTNATGETIMVKDEKVSMGFNSLTISLMYFPAGIYYIQISADRGDGPLIIGKVMKM